MTPEQLEEIPGIGEKTLERISVAVRHYFGQYEEGEVNPNAGAEEAASEEAPSEAGETAAGEAAEDESAEAKAVDEDEPGTPDEPVEEATAPLAPESDPESAETETLEVENSADAEREHPVDADDIVPIGDTAAAEGAPETEDSAQDHDQDSKKKDAENEGGA
jgi:N utilization substance protein A